jgi:hypothetical protein
MRTLEINKGKIEFHLEDDKTLRIMAGWTVILSEKEWRDYLDRFDYSDNDGFSVNDNGVIFTVGKAKIGFSQDDMVKVKSFLLS